MKRITLSIAAIALIASAAQADIKSKSFGGSASLFYGTNDSGNADLFNKGTNSYGDAAIHLGGSAAVGSCETCTTLNYGVTGVSTLGLENTLVGATWINHTLEDAIWIDTLNLTFNPLNGISNTTMVVGRQALDTPMVFTETWNIAKNTYDAAVAVNNDIVNTTLVGAWVGRSNVGGAMTVNATNGFSDDSFDDFLGAQGAFAFGAVTKAIPGVTAQAWYYLAPSFPANGDAAIAWLQADGEFAGFALGGQYIYTDVSANPDQGSAYAVKIGYNYEGLGLSAAYSSTDENSVVSNLGGSQSKLYTEAWWNYGQVSQTDTDSFNVTATYSVEGVADLGLYYTNADHTGTNTNGDMSEVAVTAGTKLGNLDATVAYIYTDIDGAPDTQNDIQAYLTYNF